MLCCSLLALTARRRHIVRVVVGVVDWSTKELNEINCIV